MLAIGYWAYDESLHSTVKKKASLVRQNADYFLVNAEISQYGETGNLDYELESTSITHYPHNDTTLLQLPLMTDYSKPEQIVRTNAQNGKLLPGNQDLELWDRVIVTQTSLEDGAKVRMDTDFITIYSERGTAETDRPVLITTETSKTRAVGMTAFYEKGLIKLKSRVRGVHEAN